MGLYKLQQARNHRDLMHTFEGYGLYGYITVILQTWCIAALFLQVVSIHPTKINCKGIHLHMLPTNKKC